MGFVENKQSDFTKSRYILSNIDKTANMFGLIKSNIVSVAAVKL